MITGHFIKISFLIEFWSKIKSTGNFYGLGGNFYKNTIKMCVFCGTLFPSVFSRTSVRYHIKHSYGVFRKDLSKDFTSNQPQDRWVDFKPGVVIWESQNPYMIIIQLEKISFFEFYDYYVWILRFSDDNTRFEVNSPILWLITHKSLDRSFLKTQYECFMWYLTDVLLTTEGKSVLQNTHIYDHCL